MIRVAALALIAAQVALGTQPAPVAAPQAAAVAPAAGPQAQADDPPVDIDQFRQMYRDACSAREYGAYDDMCDQLRQQVRAAERQAALKAREARKHPKATPFPVTPP